MEWLSSWPRRRATQPYQKTLLRRITSWAVKQRGVKLKKLSNLLLITKPLSSMDFWHRFSSTASLLFEMKCLERCLVSLTMVICLHAGRSHSLRSSLRLLHLWSLSTSGLIKASGKNNCEKKAQICVGVAHLARTECFRPGETNFG